MKKFSKGETKPLKQEHVRSGGTRIFGSEETWKMYKRWMNLDSPLHTCTKVNHRRYNKPNYYNVHFYYDKADNVKSLWYRKPWQLCWLNNHSVAKSLKRMVLDRKFMSTNNGTQHVDPYTHQNERNGKKG